MFSISARYHSYMHIGGILLLAAALPLSPFLVSVSQIIILINWLVEGSLKHKMFKLWERKALLFFFLIYAVHLLWLIPSNNFADALHDLKIKLPLLILPLVLGTGRVLKESEIKMVLLVFVSAVIVSSFFSIYRLYIISSVPMADLRDISVFISHIRLSLLVNMAIYSLIYLLLTSTFQWQRPARNSLWIGLTWLVIFLFILQSVTGIVIFIATGIFFLLKFSNLMDKQYWYIRYMLLISLSLLIVAVSSYTIYVIFSFSARPIEKAKLDIYTPAGNTYEHNILNRQMENGNYVWINVCEPEMAKEWNRRSSIDYHATDLMGHELRYTLIRYLTSLGLKKDQAGISQLTETDILHIERGMANHIYQNNKWIYPRIYQIIWELDNYFKGGNPSGHSVAQRIVYWKTGLDIIRKNPWFGVGTGDIKDAYAAQYEEDQTILDPKWQFVTHNQMLSFIISFGFIGFLIVAFGMVYPFIIEKRHARMLPFIFAVIAILSMLSEDTLTTQAGATFFAFFYSLFIFTREKYEPGLDGNPY